MLGDGRRREAGHDYVFMGRYGAPLSAPSGPLALRSLASFIVKRLGMPMPTDGQGKVIAPLPCQFRRTTARHIARYPFGVVAGARQFKHIRVATFEGYANLDRALMPEPLRDFAIEIEEERLLAEIDWREELADAVIEGRVAGPGGAELSIEFRGLVSDRGEDEARRLLKSRLTTIHIGQANFCRFRPEKAVCLEEAQGATRDRPLFSLCEQTGCANSCITERHRPAWVAMRDNARWALRQAPAKSPVREYLAADLAKIERVITGIGNQANDAPS